MRETCIHLAIALESHSLDTKSRLKANLFRLDERQTLNYQGAGQALTLEWTSGWFNWKLGMVRSALICRRFYERVGEVVTTDEYEVRFLTSYKNISVSILRYCYTTD